MTGGGTCQLRKGRARWSGGSAVGFGHYRSLINAGLPYRVGPASASVPWRGAGRAAWQAPAMGRDAARAGPQRRFFAVTGAVTGAGTAAGTAGCRRGRRKSAVTDQRAIDGRPAAAIVRNTPGVAATRVTTLSLGGGMGTTYGGAAALALRDPEHASDNAFAAVLGLTVPHMTTVAAELSGRR